MSSIDTSKVKTVGGKGAIGSEWGSSGEAMRAKLNRGYEPASCKPYESESSKVRKASAPMHSRSPEEKY